MTGDVWQYTCEPRDTYDLYLDFTDDELSQWLRNETESTICCIVEGTLVEGENGPLDIGELRVGDRIWGYDLVKQEKVPVTVLSIRRARARESLLIGEGLRVTKWHTIYVDGDWVRADRLQSTDRVVLSGGRTVQAGDIRWLQGEVTVYDIGVTAPHNFFAGEILVHNRKGP
jgi:intein/homing endonuclease